MLDGFLGANGCIPRHDSAMAVYTQLTNETIDALMRETYGLAELDFAVGIAEGVSNSNYLVVLKGKEGEEKYILTLYEKRIEAKDIPFFLNLMNYLAAGGIACPRPIPRRDGAWFGEVNGRIGALVSFLSGHSITVISPAHTASLGAAMAALHQAAAGFPQSRANGLSLAAWQGIFQTLGQALDTITPGLYALVNAELTYLQNHWPKMDALPRGIIHADLFPNNVFFVDDRLSGMIDFYFACTDFYAYELAIAINAWCFEEEVLELRGSELPSHAIRFSETKAQALLTAYERARALTPAEKNALPILLRGAALRFLLTRAQDFLAHDPGALVTPLDPLEYVAKLKWWQAKE